MSARPSLFLTTVSFLLICVIVTACKKKDDAPRTPASELVGYWTLSHYGADANDNDTLDAMEAPQVLGTGFDGHMTLRSDGTGSWYLNTGTIVKKEITWALIDTNKTFITVTGTDTLYYPISTRSGSNLTVLDTLTTPVGYWQVWMK